MELRLGKMTNREIAEWFGIKPNTLSKNKEKKLEELSFFAKHHLEESGKIFIDEIYIPVYEKQTKKNFEKVKSKFDEAWAENGIDTCKDVSDKIYLLLVKDDGKFNLKESTVYKYTRQSRDELYGKPYCYSGTKGCCKYVFAKKTENGYELFNEEEEKIKKELIKKYFKQDDEEDERRIHVAKMVNDGEISKEEAYKMINNISQNDYLDFLFELQGAIGYKVVRATQIFLADFAYKNLVDRL